MKKNPREYTSITNRRKNNGNNEKNGKESREYTSIINRRKSL